MSQKKEKSGISGKQPPPAPVMQQHPPAVMSRAPWSLSHVLRGQSMMNMPPFYHMIHVPSPLAIVNTHPMFMQQPPPSIQHHGSDGAVGSCVVSGCQALGTSTANHACGNDSPETVKTTASCTANGSCDVALIKFQQNAQLHGIKITSTTEKLERSESSGSGRFSAASPEFIPQGLVSSTEKMFTVPKDHLPGVIVVSSEDDEEEDLYREDSINCAEDNEKHEQQTGMPMMVNGDDNHAIFPENCLSSELNEVRGEPSQSASGMPLNSDGGAFFAGDCKCSKHQETVSTYTQTEMTDLGNVSPQVFDKWTSTEDLKKCLDEEMNTELTVAAVSATESNDLKQSLNKKEKSEVFADDTVASCSVKVPSLGTTVGSTTEEEMDLAIERKFPEKTDKPKINSLTPETFLLLVKQELDHNLSHLMSDDDVRDKTERQNLAGKSKTNCSTSSTSSANSQQEQSCAFMHELNGVRGELKGWKKADECETNSVMLNTSSTVIKTEHRDSVSLQPDYFRDELRRRNIAAVEAVSEMYETEQVIGDADRTTDSITTVENHLSTLTELNIKHPEVDQSHGPEDNPRRLETLAVPVIYEDQALDGGASSASLMGKRPPGPEEINDLSNVLSRSGRSSVDNCSVIDNSSGQQNGTSNHSDGSARKRKNCQADSRNVWREEAVGRFAGASVQDTKDTSVKGRNGASHSENGALKKTTNSCLENVDIKGSYSSAQDDSCSPDVTALADDESLSSSENMSVAMSASRGEMTSECSSVANSITQMGLNEPNTEVLDMIKNHLLMCDPALSNNPQMLEALAVQQLYLMHQEQVVLSQMMEAMRQHQQPQLLLTQQPLVLAQHPAQPLVTPQQLLLQQHLISQQHPAQPQLIPSHQFVMFPPTSKPQKILPPRFAARLASQGNSCTETLPNVPSSVPENWLCASSTYSSACLDTALEDSELPKKLWQDCHSAPRHVQSETVKDQDSAGKQQERSFNSVTKCGVGIKDNLTTSAVNGLSAEPSASSHGKMATSSAFPPNRAQSESAVTSPDLSSHSTARAQLAASSPSVASSGNGKPTDLSDCKRTDLSGQKKSLFTYSANNREVLPSVPLSSLTKPSHSSVLTSEKIGPAIQEAAASKSSDLSFSARGQGGSGGRGAKPRSVIAVGNFKDAASADGYLGSFQSWEQSGDSVSFSKGEYEKDKLLEFKQTLEDPNTQGSATEGEFVTNRKDFVPEKKVICNRRMEVPFRRTSAHFHQSEEDWELGEDESAGWIKNAVHYGPPKCNSSRLRPKNGDLGYHE